MHMKMVRSLDRGRKRRSKEMWEELQMRKTDDSVTKHESFTPEEEDLIIKMHAATMATYCTTFTRKDEKKK
ncbi:hypothetical protein Bca52824_031918 [Brassica carinata]|uniref:Uncharacterized protein n=1 Tax=Brassica carinata TaxID=52824 RepID=A0A8X7SC28_BRACI|nr:hypothetical protein Bca52824_031918 [Brassica carinata]